ncbi:MAG: hypothetical protein ACYTCU_05470 [Planctomycetota bacterium]|jgi:hypothetical protein
MRLALLSFAFLSATLALAPDAASQASIEFLSASTDTAYKVSADGTRVSGSASGGGFLWTSGGGEVLVGGAQAAIGASDDGTVMGGTANLGGGTGPARWTSGTGWVALPFLGVTGCPDFGTSYDISADGSTIVGLGWDGCSAMAFKWDATNGMVGLPQTGTSARSNAVSGNGQVVGGWQQFANRSPSLWLADGTEILPDTTAVGEFQALSFDGSIAVGGMNKPGGFFSEHMIWTAADGPTFLGSVAGFPGSSSFYSVNADGTVAGGGIGSVSPFDPNTANATIWSKDSGEVRLLEAVLAEQGVTIPADWNLQFVMGMSADGSVICGQMQGPGFGNFRGFIATIDTDLIGPWTDLGNALAGTHGEPELCGAGMLNAGDAVTIDLTNALENSTAWLAVGFTQANAPFKGGVMVPSVSAPGFLFSLPTDANGETDITAAWPGGVPSGFELFLQCWVQDGAAPVGFSASNAVMATAP